MPTSGRCVTADTLVFHYGAINVAPIQKDQPLFRRRGDYVSKYINLFRTNKNLVMVSTGPENKDDCAGKD
jgi:hypothetical protein